MVHLARSTLSIDDRVGGCFARLCVRLQPFAVGGDLRV